MSYFAGNTPEEKEGSGNSGIVAARIKQKQ